MQKELKAAGRDIAFLAVNSADSFTNQTELAASAEFPMFQDTDPVGAWKMHGGGKDDLYVYGSDGKLVRYLPYGGEVDTNLSDPVAYEGVKKIVVDAK
ncbi:MAG: hypothetical protein HYV09_30160 [Deltaproteobacteria bacterium]|nr:hypothetical protein [Deltaproteobacteria bacterium]